MGERTAVGPRDLIRSRLPAMAPGGPRTTDEIAGVAAIIAEGFWPERIVLFGSHARGEAGPDSDVDLMVIMPTPLKPTEQAVRIRLAVSAQYRFPMDILVRTPEQVALGLAEGDFFLTDALTQGATLFPFRV